MSNLIPFESGNLPAYLKNTNPSELNADLTSHAGSGFPIMSIKGKVFTLVRDGERKILPNPKDPDSPATSIEVVLVKANKGTSKVYYIDGYSEGAEAKKPDCFSNDGAKPDAGSSKPQSKSCALCPHNQWGSKIGDNGATKGKACQDSVRVAIAAADQINDPMLLRVPPASIRALGEYGQMLGKRGVAYNMAVTKISFDMESPTPKLMFKPVGLLPEDGYNEVRDVIDSDTVRNILGAMGMTAVEAPETASDDEKVVEAAKASSKAAVSKSKTVAKEEVAEAAEEAPKKAATVKVSEVEIEGLDLADLNFDD